MNMFLSKYDSLDKWVLEVKHHAAGIDIRISVIRLIIKTFSYKALNVSQYSEHCIRIFYLKPLIISENLRVCCVKIT